MKNYYLRAIKKDHIESMKLLAIYFKNKEKNYSEMKKYYQMAIDLGDAHSMYLYGFYFQSVEKDYEQMEKYFKLAIETDNHITAILSLAEHYKDNKKYSLMEKYYKLGADIGDGECTSELGEFYYLINKYSEAIKYLEISVDKHNNIISLMYLTRIYKEQKKYDQMVKYYKLGSELKYEESKDSNEVNHYHIKNNKDYKFKLEQDYIKKNDQCKFELAKYYYIIEKNSNLALSYLNSIKFPDDDTNKLIKKIVFDYWKKSRLVNSL
jgi:hypothetical protein